MSETCNHKYILRPYGAECHNCFKVITHNEYKKLPREQQWKWKDIDDVAPVQKGQKEGER